MIQFKLTDPRYTYAAVGLLPEFFDERNPQSARDQLHEAYAHGGGVHPFKGFDLIEVDGKAALQYPGDPLAHEIARATCRDETIILFAYSWVAIVQKNGAYIVTRCD